MGHERIRTEDEQALLNHITMWGSDGYPIQKVGNRHWTYAFRSIRHPVLFTTKREAVTAFETYLDIVIDSKREIIR